MQMEKAVYCTCWDGNIDIAFDADGAPLVEPLGTNSAASAPLPSDPAEGRQSCRIDPADIFTPIVKPPDQVKVKPADYYMLSLSWSPQFCSTNASMSTANRFQCQENSFGIVVHGLWPQSAGVTNGQNQPRNCKPATPIAATTLSRHLCTVPGIELMQGEWAKHGTCAFDAPEKFLNTIESLMSQLHIPDLPALAADKGPNLRAHDVTGALIGANPGLSAPDIQLLAQSSNLQEIHICYGLDLKFRKCDTTPS